MQSQLITVVLDWNQEHRQEKGQKLDGVMANNIQVIYSLAKPKIKSKQHNSQKFGSAMEIVYVHEIYFQMYDNSTVHNKNFVN